MSMLDAHLLLALACALAIGWFGLLAWALLRGWDRD